MNVGKIVTIDEAVDRREPLVLWLDSLDKIMRARIKTRIDILAGSAVSGGSLWIKSFLKCALILVLVTVYSMACQEKVSLYCCMAELKKRKAKT